jgi:hypothetical protein
MIHQLFEKYLKVFLVEQFQSNYFKFWGNRVNIIINNYLVTQDKIIIDSKFEISYTLSKWKKATLKQGIKAIIKNNTIIAAVGT